MPYISHGYWVGPGEPTEPAPPRARCGGPGLCPVCGPEAFAIDQSLCVRLPAPPSGPQRRRYATRDELADLLADTTPLRRLAGSVSRYGIRALLAGLATLGVDVDALVEITVAEPEVVQHGRSLGERIAAAQPRITLR
jgi:hypothetical protein